MDKPEHRRGSFRDSPHAGRARSAASGVRADPFYDTQLTPGETYYRVRAVSVSTGEPSEYSQAVTAGTWANAFTANLGTATPEVDASHDCIVQRFDPPSLARGGNLIAISAQATNDGTLRILTMSLGAERTRRRVRFAAAARRVPGPYSSASNIITIKTKYRVEPHKPLLVAFDVDDPGQTRFGTANHVTAYTKEGTEQQPVREAGVADRSGFTARPNQVWMITSIDVATEWP